MKEEKHSVLMAGIMKDGFSYIVPIRALTDKRLGDGELRLLVLYTCFANMKRHRIDALHKTLARLLNVSVRTVIYREKTLEKLGYIKIKSGQKDRTANIIIVDYDKGAAKSRTVPWKEKEVCKKLHTSIKSPMQSPAYSTMQSVAHIEDKSKECPKEKEENSPFGDYTKSNEKKKTAPDLVRLFFGLIDKGWAKDGFKVGVGIVQNLIDRRYAINVLEKAMRWGVKEKGMMDLTQFGNIVNWYMRVKKTEETDLKQELKGLGPAAREALLDKRRSGK